MSLDVWLYGACEDDDLFAANITHNLGKMANAARIYKELWRPAEIGIKTAGELIYPLKQAIRDIAVRPEYYRRYNALNGWGLYKHFLPWLKEYWRACVRNPNANIGISR